MKYFIVMLLCFLVTSCGERYATSHTIMQDMGPYFNSVGEAINDKNADSAKVAYKKLHDYISSDFYLGYREKLERDAQTRWKKMEKRIFDMGKTLNSPFSHMGKAYRNARTSCMECHMILRSDNREFLNKEIVRWDQR